MKISTLGLLALFITLSFQITEQTIEQQIRLDGECPASHFDLVGTYTLGKQDELNRTFTKLNEKITEIGNITFNSTPTTQYTIYNTKPKFFYRDSNQKAKINGNDTIVVYGGKLQVDITFSWTKYQTITRNGTGSCFGLSDMISFAKQIIIENGSSYSYQLLDYTNVTWGEDGGEPFKLTRIDPPDASEDDKAVLHRMLNNILGYQTIRNQLEDQIDKIYSYYLRNSLYDQHMHIDGQFDYKWQSRANASNITISMIRRPVSIDIESDGIRASFDIQAEQATNWKCGSRHVPSLPRNPKIYGSLQQFVSYDFYENMLRFAIEKGYMDIDLTRENWESTMFQFFVGDLYEIFPKLQTIYYANEKVDGNCKASYKKLEVLKSTHQTFNVSIYYDCELSARREKFVDFSVGLTLQIQGQPDAQFQHFKLRRHDQFPSFYPYGGFEIKNEELAALMVKHSLNRLYEVNLFGSGYPVSPPRDYPHMIMEDNYTIVYDSTHVDLEHKPKDQDYEELEYLVLPSEE